MPLSDWTLLDTEHWLTTHNFDHAVIRQFTQNNITGDVLPYLTDQDLHELELSIKERVRLRIEINRLIAEEGLTYEQSTLTSVIEGITSLIQKQVDDSARATQEEIRARPLPTPEKLSPFSISPTKGRPAVSPRSQRNSMLQNNGGGHNGTVTASTPALSSMVNTPLTSHNSISQHTLNASTHSFHSSTSMTANHNASSSGSMSEPLKQLRASTEDPTSKILQSAMKRHNLNDDWRNYALVICHGDNERILEMHEKPVLIFKELRARGEHPAIMLRKIGEVGASSSTPGGKL